ncbi:MAG: hypothetical protein ACNI27_02575 [Desulfovibrio sp.]
MIDKATALETVLLRFKKMPVNESFDLRTYKRNRSLLITKTSDDGFQIIQNGYEYEIFEDIPLKKMKKLLKLLFKKEFPRSTKLRLYNLGECDPEELSQLKRKKI